MTLLQAPCAQTAPGSVTAGQSVASRTWQNMAVSVCSYPAYSLQAVNRHPSLAAFLLIRGSIYIRSGSSVRELRPLETAVIPRDYPHQLEVGPDGALGVYCALAEDLLRRLNIETPLEVAILTSQDAQLAGLRFLQEIRRVSTTEKLQRSALDLFRPLQKAGVELPLWLQQVSGTINRDYLKPLNLAKLAETASVAPAQFGRAFRQAFGNSPADYIAQLRLLYAGRKVLAHAASVQEAAAEAGIDAQPLEECFGLEPAQLGGQLLRTAD